MSKRGNLLSSAVIRAASLLLLSLAVEPYYLRHSYLRGASHVQNMQVHSRGARQFQQKRDSLSIHIYQPLRYIINDKGPSLLMACPRKLPDRHPATTRRDITFCRPKADFTDIRKACDVEAPASPLTVIEGGSRRDVMCTPWPYQTMAEGMLHDNSPEQYKGIASPEREQRP